MNSVPSIAIRYSKHFHVPPDGKLMGANSASEGFLRAYLRYSGEQTFHAIVDNQESAKSFVREVREYSSFPNPQVRLYPSAMTPAFAEVGGVFNLQPLLDHQAWQREWEGADKYSIIGITHTTCTQTVMDALGQLMIAPLQPWDALICTSESVKSSVQRVWENWFSYLSDRLGAGRKPLIELPVIPLGVDCDQFERVNDGSEHREKHRARLGIDRDDVAFLFFGRLSFHAKANPFPMYRALEETAHQSHRKIHLILAGWFANKAIEDHFRHAAEEVCPSVRLIVVDGRKLDVKREIWSAADVFTSLSDNIQETFGLTPVEAMAAGLPSVISDWDGYRDTVRHGIDGFRIPTTIASAGDGDIFIRRHFEGIDNYDRYVGHVSHFIAVDIPKTIEAYTALCENRELRLEMGAAARRRAREYFDWRVVIDRYQELWRELKDRRLKAEGVTPPRNQSPHPLRVDPFCLFSEYATTQLGTETQLSLGSASSTPELPRLHQAPYLAYLKNPTLLASIDECQQVLSNLDRETKTSEELIRLFPQHRQGVMRRSLVWMLKVGLLRLS